MQSELFQKLKAIHTKPKQKVVDVCSIQVAFLAPKRNFLPYHSEVACGRGLLPKPSKADAKGKMLPELCKIYLIFAYISQNIRKNIARFVVACNFLCVCNSCKFNGTFCKNGAIKRFVSNPNSLVA